MWNQPDPVATWLIFGSVWALIALRAVSRLGSSLASPRRRQAPRTPY
jgi:hypothetical protein